LQLDIAKSVSVKTRRAGAVFLALDATLTAVGTVRTGNVYFEVTDGYWSTAGNWGVTDGFGSRVPGSLDTAFVGYYNGTLDYRNCNCTFSSTGTVSALNVGYGVSCATVGELDARAAAAVASISAMPEPSTLALLAAGLIGLTGYTCRKRKQP
jgi:hypothetical protein